MRKSSRPARPARTGSLRPDGGAAAMSPWVRRSRGGRKAEAARSQSVPSGKRWEGTGRAVAAP
ncbi:MAG TPA: hypothetical protein VFR85_11290 [Anaeromyxobacteraceae bacterium]|nr:hypothetical protein [Anaeromyxobacteraceae bacterium]